MFINSTAPRAVLSKSRKKSRTSSVSGVDSLSIKRSSDQSALRVANETKRIERVCFVRATSRGLEYAQGCTPGRNLLHREAKGDKSSISRIQSDFEWARRRVPKETQNCIHIESIASIRAKRYTRQIQLAANTSFLLLAQKAAMQGKSLLMISASVPVDHDRARIGYCSHADTEIASRFLSSLQVLTNSSDGVVFFECEARFHVHVYVITNCNSIPSESIIRQLWSTCLPESCHQNSDGSPIPWQNLYVDVRPFKHNDDWEFSYPSKSSQKKAKRLSTGQRVTPRRWFVCSEGLEKETKASPIIESYPVSRHKAEQAIDALKRLIPGSCKPVVSPYNGREYGFHTWISDKDTLVDALEKFADQFLTGPHCLDEASGICCSCLKCSEGDCNLNFEWFPESGHVRMTVTQSRKKKKTKPPLIQEQSEPVVQVPQKPIWELFDDVIEPTDVSSDEVPISQSDVEEDSPVTLTSVQNFFKRLQAYITTCYAATKIASN